MRRTLKRRKNYSSSDESQSSNPKNHRRKHRQRVENSLGELTKNVIKFIKNSGEKQIHINNLVTELVVKKRRIYDITNVLEGIGCIRKLEKNKLEWVDESLYNDTEHTVNLEIDKLNAEIKTLKNEEENLEKWISELKIQHEQLNNDQKAKDYCYLTYNDIKMLTQGEDINLIAIRAPSGTTLEIPDPENVAKVFVETEQNMKRGVDKYDKDLLDSLQKKYQLFLESPNGEINVFLVLSSNNKQIQNDKFFSFDESEVLVDSKTNQKMIHNENVDIKVDL